MPADAPPAALDSQAFARDNGRLSGTSRLAHYPRLLVETQGHGADRMLGWAAEGSLRADPSSASQAELPAADQQVLLGRVVLLSSQGFSVNKTEPSVNHRVPVQGLQTALAGQGHTGRDLEMQPSLAELIEDELLMALPLVPRHEACPGELKMAVADPGFEAPESQPPHPFASLARLRRGPD